VVYTKSRAGAELTKRLLDLYAGGLSIERISLLTGLKPQTTERFLAKAGVVVDETRRTEPTEMEETPMTEEESIRFVDVEKEPSTGEELLWASCAAYHRDLLEQGEVERVMREQGISYREAYREVRDKAYAEWTGLKEDMRELEEERHEQDLVRFYEEEL
jgi:hypothetical protein